MTIEQLQERIAKAIEKKEKKQNTILKKTLANEKKVAELKEKFQLDMQQHCYSQLESLGFTKEQIWEIFDIEHSYKWYVEDIKSLNRAIAEIDNTLLKYNKQLAGEIEKEEMFIKDIPSTMKELQVELVNRWDAWDIERRDLLKKQYHEIGRSKWFEYHGLADYDLMYKTDEMIHKSNTNDSKLLIIDMYNRIKHITGDVISWAGVRCEQGNMCPVLTGYVEGIEGSATIETILAGGYNIQRLHIRTLVHPR